MKEIKSIENMSFEEALVELELIVKKIDTGEQSLDEAINAYERGMQLRKQCELKLNDAKLKIEKVVKTEDNKFTLEEAEL